MHWPLASRDCTYLRLCKRVGEHVVAGTPLAWIWHADPDGLCALARRPLGDYLVRDTDQRAAVIIPGRRFGDYLSTMCGLIRRYGAKEPTVSVALIRLLANCAAVVEDDPARWQAIAEQADLILADATREVAQPRDLTGVQTAEQALQQTLHRHLRPPPVNLWGDPEHPPHGA